MVDFYWKADTRPLHQTIDSILAEKPGAISDAADGWFLCALAERDPMGAERALVALGDNSCFGDNTILLSRSFGEGLLARMMKDERRRALPSPKLVLSRRRSGKRSGLWAAALRSGPDRRGARAKRGVVARRAARHRTSSRGKRILQWQSDAGLFRDYRAWTDEKDLALQHLATSAQSPGGSVVASYGGLKLLPFWDPLRGDPLRENRRVTRTALMSR
jgi:hypothetical protein